VSNKIGKNENDEMKSGKRRGVRVEVSDQNGAWPWAKGVGKLVLKIRSYIAK